VTARHDLVVSDQDYAQWNRDGAVLAEIGHALFRQSLGVSVRLPRQLAEAAVASCDRESSDQPLPDETSNQTATRKRAAALALIGLSVQNASVEEGDDVVELDAWFIGQALDAAEQEGLIVPPSTEG
jgi:hypothetical protein